MIYNYLCEIAEKKLYTHHSGSGYLVLFSDENGFCAILFVDTTDDEKYPPNVFFMNLKGFVDEGAIWIGFSIGALCHYAVFVFWAGL